jgi:hypothetical protein
MIGLQGQKHKARDTNADLNAMNKAGERDINLWVAEKQSKHN